MRQFYTVVLERIRRYKSDFQTEPYEVGWASEAMFFIRMHELTGSGTVIEARVQVSVDGIHWIDEGTSFPAINHKGDNFIRVSHFGGWLRLACTLAGKDPEVELTVQLALKE